jgi:hypothetical protein
MSRIFGEARQVGYIVEDIGKAMAFLIEKAGVGPWHYAEQVSMKDCRYKGAPQTIELAIALANSGSLQFELIQQRNDAPSIYRDWLARYPGRRLVQHYSSWSDRYDEVFKAALGKGFEPLLEGKTRFGPFVYFGHPDDPDFMFEVTEYTPERRFMFERIAEAAAGWDGRDPIRRGWPDPSQR